jgi:MFS family permease
LIIASLTSSLIMLDSNIVSLPAMASSLHGSFQDIEWIVSAYLLGYASLLLPTGSYADLRGRRGAMILGLIALGVASIFCGLASSLTLLNLARAAQGVGGAFLLTSSLAVINAAFVGPERNRAFAVWGASLGIALTLGPIGRSKWMKAAKKQIAATKRAVVGRVNQPMLLPAIKAQIMRKRPGLQVRIPGKSRPRASGSRLSSMKRHA